MTPPAGSDALPTNSSHGDWLCRESAIDAFEARWQQHGPAPIADFLPPLDSPHRRSVLVELVHIDIEYRAARGERRTVENYGSEFPELFVETSLNHRGSSVIGATCRIGPFNSDGPNVESQLATSAIRRIGRYEVIEEIGRGAFATVFRARDTELNRDVAIKVTRPELTEDAASRARVLREAQSAARLRHPGIVPIFEVGEDAGTAYIVFEFVIGPTLAAWLRDQRPSPQQAAAWVAEIAEALDYAHACGIVHRDVKPANVMMERREENRGQRSEVRDQNSDDAARSDLCSLTSDLSPKLADFGLALQADATTTLTQQGDVLGTPGYMSPEQARGEGHEVDARTDVYSLGAMLYEMLVGRLPFEGSGARLLRRVIEDEPPSLRSVRPGVSRDIETICLKAMAKEPARRYASAGAMADDLRRFLEHRPILARRVGVAGRFVLWCRRRPAIAATIAIATVVTLAAAAASYWRVVRERDRAELLAATFAFDRALNHCEQGETGVGMLWLARSLELAPSHATDLQSAIRANLGAWQHELTVPVGIVKQSEPVESLSFSDEGRQVIARSGGGRSRAWHVDTGESAGDVADGTRGDDFATSEVVRRLPHPGGVRAAALSPDGERVITGGPDNTARLWATKAGEAIGPPLQHRGEVEAVAFSRDGQTALTGSLDRTARLWHVPTGEPASQPLRHAGRVSAVATSPDGRHVATGSRDGTVYLWAVGGRTAEIVLEHDHRVWTAVFTPDGERVVTASGNIDTPGTAQLWHASTGERIGQPMRHRSMIRELGVSQDGRTLVTGSWSDYPTVRIWDAATQEPLGSPTVLPNGVTAVALSPDGRVLVSACISEPFAQAWELTMPIAEDPPGTRESLVARFQLKHDEPVRSIAFSRDGRRILTGSYDRTAQQWDAASGQRIGEPLRNRGEVGAVAFSRDSKFILTGTDEGHAQLWRADSGRPAGLPLKHDGTVRGVAFSPDGQLLATASWDKTARLWHAATCKPVGPAMRHGGEVESVTFSPDGRSVVTASWDKTARFWSVPSPVEGSVAEVVPWVESLTGMTLDSSESAQVLDADSWKARRDRVRTSRK